jgi:hypothetical protein
VRFVSEGNKTAPCSLLCQVAEAIYIVLTRRPNEETAALGRHGEKELLKMG